MEERHLPGDDAAPVVADEDGALQAERVEESDEIASEMVDVVVLGRRRRIGLAIAPLVGRDRPVAGRR